MPSSQGRKIPDLAVPRLSRYYRALLESRESDVISSEELSRLTGHTAAQIRRDLACFGQFGTPGRGYAVTELKTAILSILGIDQEWRVALVGAGNLGQALLGYEGFKKQGFNVLFAFDNDREKIGKTIHGVLIHPSSEMTRLIREHDVRMAILTVPSRQAQEIINELADNGIRAILNFAPVRLKVPEGVTLQNIDMAIELERLSYLTLRKPGKNGSNKDITQD